MLLKQLILRFRRVPAAGVQLLLVVVSFWAAFQLRFDLQPPDWAYAAMLEALPWVLLIRGITFLPFRLYEGLWRYTSIYDLQVLLVGILVSTVGVVLYVVSPFGPEAFPRSIFIIDALLLTVFLGGLRMARRLYDEFRIGKGNGRRRVLVYGAGSAGQMIVREMRRNPGAGLVPIGFIDDDPAKKGLRIHGVRVLGSGKAIAGIIDETDPTEVLIAIPQLEPMAIRTIARELEPFNLPIKTLPNLRDIIDGQVGVAAIRTLALEDLLARAPVGLDAGPLTKLVRGRRVLVTGAGGSIGSELCRQILKLRPERLLMLERYENSLHAIRLELEDAADPQTREAIVPVVGDVTDGTAVAKFLKAHRPAIVFHAAAHKHVPLMEESPCEAVKNNVRGTRLLAEAAAAAGVERFIMISTDKAANPSSIMGASKRVAELVIQTLARTSKTSFSIVRFGNVLGSNGSVVPRFMEQIRKGGPVTVTHPDVRRFFMVIPEAVQLVLHAAAQAARGGTFVLDMGEQMKVADVARNLIRLSGLVPDEDIRIVYTGLRPGEKLEEELFGGEERLLPSLVPNVFVVESNPPVPASLWPRISELEALAVSGDGPGVRAALHELAGAPLSEPAPQPAVPVAVRDEASAGYTQQCPRCDARVHRSRSRGVHHRLRKRFTSTRLFRCNSCGWRGWLHPTEVAPPVPIASSRPDPPDLTALDRQ